MAEADFCKQCERVDAANVPACAELRTEIKRLRTALQQIRDHYGEPTHYVLAGIASYALGSCSQRIHELMRDDEHS